MTTGPGGERFDYPERLSGGDAVGHAIDRPHGAGGGEEMRLQIVDLEQRARRRCGRTAARRLDLL